MIAALTYRISDIKDVDAVDLASCPWKLAMSGVALQMALQQANSSDDNISSAAYHTLDAILAKFLHKSMTAEEADFIAGVARGADGTVAKKVHITYLFYIRFSTDLPFV
jgi:hypothetical protein